MHPRKLAEIEQVTIQNIYTRINEGYIPVLNKKKIHVDYDQYVRKYPNLKDLYKQPQNYYTIESAQKKLNLSKSSIHRKLRNKMLSFIVLPSKGNRLIRVKIIFKKKKSNYISVEEFCDKTGDCVIETKQKIKHKIFASTKDGMIDLKETCKKFKYITEYFNG